MESEFSSGSGEAAKVKADDVVELVEGPRQEKLGSVMRMRGKAASDGKTGWFTLKDRAGNESATKGGKCYTCTSSVAITDVLDIKSCKVLKKLAVDEVFTATEEPQIEEGGMERVKGKGLNDGVEGWVTIKGNAGTVYAKVNDKLYTISKSVDMQAGFASSSSVVRNLAAGEAIEVLEGPREEKFIPANRAKVRTSGDSAAVGWISVRSDSFRAGWKPLYKFVKAAKLYATKDSKESVVREVVAGETIDLVEGPVEVDGKMWMKGHMKKDGVTGWSPIKSDDGARLLMQGQ